MKIQRKYQILKPLIILVLLAFIVPFKTFAQAKLTASASSTSVGLNGSINVTYTLTGGQAEAFTKPAFAKFSVVGTSHSSGGGMQVWVNGKLVQGGDGEESWIYTVAPTAIGKFTIDAAKVKVKGQWVSSNTLTIDVTKSSSAQNQNQNQNQNQQKGSEGNTNDLFLKAYVDKTNPIQGEQIVVTYKIYTRIPVTQYTINKLSSFNGFWTQDLIKDKSKPPQYNETVNGVKYTVAEIRKVALFPQKSGTLTIDPQEIECIAQVQVKGGNNNVFNDPFFNNPFFQNPFGSVQNVKRTLKSNAIKVNVSPLPTTDKPVDFSGAVGEFTFKGEIDHTDVKQNEAINLKFTVSGTGNISLIDKLGIDFPSDFEVYDPQTTDNISTAGDKVSGTRVFDYLIIPRTAGAFDIKPVSFSFFDLKRKAYVTLSSQGYHIRVAKGQGGSGPVYGGASKEDVKYIGSDVRYLNSSIFPLEHIGWFFFNSPLYYLLLALPVVLFIIFVIIWRRRLKLRSNVILLKNMRATGIAKKRLKTAHGYMMSANKEQFYQEVSQALWGYLGDKFAIPVAGLSLETVREKLLSSGMPQELPDSLVKTLNKCEYARFAPSDGSLSMDQIYNEAAEIIKKVEEQVKNKKQKA